MLSPYLPRTYTHLSQSPAIDKGAMPGIQPL